VVFGNTLGEYVFAAVFCVLFFGVLLVVNAIVLKIGGAISDKTKNKDDDTVVDVVRTMNKWFYGFLALYAATKTLVLSDVIVGWMRGVLIVWTGYQVISGFIVVVDHVLSRFFAANIDDGEEERGESTRTFVGMIVRAVVWIGGGLYILDLLGVNVGSLAAGLGVGGIIIAFALQSVLSDLFSTFVIHAEKPFKPGDFIVVGEHRGTVKSIGIKTTRIQALQGEEIVISNQEMTSARVQNFKMMEERRVLTTVGLTYDTSVETMRTIPDMIKKIVEQQDGVRFGRAHFRSFGGSALEIEFVYFVLSNDYDVYMNVQQAINFEIMEMFARERVEFAFPTQTVHVKKG